MKPTAVRVYENGFLPLVSVIPPNAPLSPNTKIRPEQRGKVPGRRNQNGTWGGYNWLEFVPKIEHVRRWAEAGANIGLKAEFYPAVDIDTIDEWLANEIASIARRVLGPAPERVGQPPKRLLVYRTGAPFVRVAAVITMDGEKHLVEVLGAGRQYLIDGQHPNGHQYRWDRDITTLRPDDLTMVTHEKIEAFLTELQHLELVPGISVERVGGKAHERQDQPQDDLRAPSIEALRACVEAIPNTNAMFQERDEYIQFGYAVKAAAGPEHEADGLDIYLSWCARWEDGQNDPEIVRGDWDRMRPPFAVGWTWLAEIAQRCGFAPAQFEFRADPAVQVEREREGAPDLSDVWLAEQVITDFGQALRYVPLTGRWYVWDAGRWVPDAVLLADHLVGRTLRRLAVVLARRGATDGERKMYRQVARDLCSATRHKAVRHILRSDPRITAPPEAFDADPWVLATPGGLVDLRDVTMRAHDPAAMCSRRASVTPDFEATPDRWLAFLREATGGDVELQAYLQRLAGYALTGDVSEQILAFIWGPGGNGKSVFLATLAGVLGDYAETAPMDTFTEGAHGHPTDLAGLVGARLVSAHETQSGRRWDEQRVKALTGGDAVRARYMRQDFFTYRPQFKLLFVGNHRPAIRDLDEAMRRRIHLVPFTVTPAEVDTHLVEKLREEYPAILAWMLQGCADWRKYGALMPPPAVVAATADYFEAEDPVGRWLDERAELTPDGWEPVTTLFHSWASWANERGEFVGTAKRLGQLLVARHLEARKRERAAGIAGLTLINRTLNDDLPGG